MALDVVTGGGLTAHIEKSTPELGLEYASTMDAGWWYGVMLSGDIATEQVGFGKGSWQHNSFVHFWSEDGVDTFHRITSTAPVSAVFLHIEPDAAQVLLGPDCQLIMPSIGGAEHVIQSGPINTAMGHVAAQMLTSTRSGLDRRLYLAGRAYDLISSLLSYQRVLKDHAEVSLAHKDMGRIADAVDILIDEVHAPPTAPELAARVGLSSKKLAQGFKAKHGVTLGVFTKELRLNEARRMLEDGAGSVSAVAYALGYSPAHLSVEFKNHFGFCPSSLIGH